jgi:hypothetical protein
LPGFLGHIQFRLVWEGKNTENYSPWGFQNPHSDTLITNPGHTHSDIMNNKTASTVSAADMAAIEAARKALADASLSVNHRGALRQSAPSCQSFV